MYRLRRKIEKRIDISNVFMYTEISLTLLGYIILLVMLAHQQLMYKVIGG